MDIVKLLMKLGVNIVIILSGPYMDIVKLLMKLGVNIVIILSGPCGHSEASNEAGGQYCYYPLRAMWT